MFRYMPSETVNSYSSSTLSSFRLELLKHQLSHLEQFDQAVLALTQSSESFLSGLRSSSQVDVADLEAAITEVKVQTNTFSSAMKSFMGFIH